MLDQLQVAMLNVLAQAPNPGNGDPPPGSGKVLTILKWTAWLGLAACVIGVIIAGAAMAVHHRRGGAGDHAAQLGWVMAGCVVVGSASALVGALV